MYVDYQQNPTLDSLGGTAPNLMEQNGWKDWKLL